MLPKYKYYEILFKRRESFDGSWSNNPLLPNSSAMSYAGFFYTGVSDVCVCYNCGLALNNWAQNVSKCNERNAAKSTYYITRRNVDPLSEHYFHDSECSYLNTLFYYPNNLYSVSTKRQLPGNDEYVRAIKSNYEDVCSSLERERMKLIEWMSASHTHMSKIRATLDKCLNTLHELNAYVPMIEYSTVDSADTFASLLSMMKDVETAVTEQRTIILYPSKEFNDSESNNVDESIDAQIVHANRCCICLSDAANVIFLPCRHATCCSICSKEIKSCPLCREPLWFVVKCI